MRPLLFALMLSAAPTALWAEMVEMQAPVTRATVFPQGAQVTRAIAVPEGADQVLVTGLPAGLALEALRFQGTGVTVTAASLIDGRLPASERADQPAIAAARAEVERLADILRGKEEAVAVIRAGAEAAAAEITYLKSLGGGDADPDKIAAVAEALRERMQSAIAARIAAEAEAARADRALDADRKALAAAQQALAALEHPETDGSALMLWVDHAGTVEITSYIADASWQPSYDLEYDAAAESLELKRFFNVRQGSGEDWQNVMLTLSAAQPEDVSTPPEMWPRLLRIMPDEPVAYATKMARGEMAMADAAQAEPMIEAAPAMEKLGEVPVYHLNAPRDLRDGVEGLRIEWARETIAAEHFAETAPLADPAAYEVVAGDAWKAPLALAGPAMVYRDGVMIGATDLPMLVEGAPFRIGMGRVHALEVARMMPDTMEGDRGVISKTNTRREVVEISVTNHGTAAWPLRVVDRLPYSEQEDLEVRTQIAPEASETDIDGKRGVIAWRFDLAAGAAKMLRSETAIRWPADQVLR